MIYQNDGTFILFPTIYRVLERAAWLVKYQARKQSLGLCVLKSEALGNVAHEIGCSRMEGPRPTYKENVSDLGITPKIVFEFH